MQKAIFLLLAVVATTASQVDLYGSKSKDSLHHHHYSAFELENAGQDGLKFVEGLVFGLLNEDITAIEQCAEGASSIIDDMNRAIHAFAQRDIAGIIEGTLAIYNLITSLP